MLRRFGVWLRLMAVLFAIVLAVGYAVYSTDWFQKNYLYPFPHQEIIYRYALEYDLSPFLIAAVIRTESKFVPTARSPKGAVGLMQLMPETANWIAAQLEFKDYDIKVLENPETNIRFGTWYLASLKREFGDNEVLVLAAYNGGRGNVGHWMKQYGWSGSFRDIEQIPFRETREYVAKVLRDTKRYQELYGR
ncbi:MAG: lytic transglycosylase domain-containing protein [Negativicutes bacterium]|nr:lytic transglycosylase domain-containing protein [Negativicutes bacterium]